MNAHLDMNSRRVINLAEPVNGSDAVRLTDLENFSFSSTDLATGAFGADLLATATASSARVLLGVNFFYNVTDYGAIGDGSTDDEPYIQQAINAAGAAGGGVVAFPAGHTFIVGAQLECSFANITFLGFGPTSIMKWKTGVTNTGPMLYITGAACEIDNMTFQGDVYNAFGDTINPGTLVRFGVLGLDTETTKARIMRCRFIGGKYGLAVWNSSDTFIHDVYCYKNYEHGLFTSSGAKRMFISKMNIQSSGLLNGFKFGFNDLGGATYDFVIDGFIIKDCGKLDSNSALWQEGMDLYASEIRRGIVCNGIIHNCGAGGIEIKSNHTTFTGTTDEFEQLYFHNVHVIHDGSHAAFTMNWMDYGTSGSISSPASDPDKLRRIKFSNCSAIFEPSNSASAHAFAMDAYQDVFLEGCISFGAANFIRTNGSGSTTASVRRLRVNNCYAETNVNGLLHLNGGLDDVLFTNTTIKATTCPLLLGQGTASQGSSNIVFRNCSLISTGTGANQNAAQFYEVDSCLFDTCYFESEYKAVVGIDSTPDNTGGLFRNCHMKCRSSSAGTKAYAFSASDGTWTLLNTYFEIPDSNARSWANFGSATIKTHNNERGVLSSAPTTQGGALGDFFGIYNAAAGGYWGYICTGAADNSATWKGVGAIAA